MDNCEMEAAQLREQLEAMQEKLRKQEKMASIGMLSAGIAHEVQNPLNFVLNFSKLSNGLLTELNGIIEDCTDKIDENDALDLQDIIKDLKDNMDKIQEHGNRAISVIRGILMQSRGKEGIEIISGLNWHPRCIQRRENESWR